MIDHNVMRLYVPVHDSLAVAVVQAFEQLVDIVSDINVVELGVQAPEIGIVDVFEDEGRRLALQHRQSVLSSRMHFVYWPRGVWDTSWAKAWERTYLAIPHNIQQSNNVWATGQILQDLDLSLDLLLLHGLEHLDDAFLIVDNVNALKDFRVFTPACIVTGVGQYGGPMDGWRDSLRDVPILRTTS